MSNKLDNIKLGYSPLSDTIYMYRHGKDPALALDKREAEADVVTVLVRHMMEGCPKGSQKTVTINGNRYNIRVTPAK